ncbi:hypothetical protein XENOCAPTIV_018039 [Xenoophorus captivus]|uniref:Uncharacterized protein n=1 Tax=Xenoophorus captivus TaxID=1517983 RepID=A0ABV0QSH9_9TELE
MWKYGNAAVNLATKKGYTYLCFRGLMHQVPVFCQPVHFISVIFCRHHLITLGVAVDILGCTGTVIQRATVLHKVILLAEALKENVHNLFSFSAVMKALEMSQGPIAVPHLVPLVMVMEGEDPVENGERGCEVLYNVLQAARSAALHSQDHQKHAESLLTGTCEALARSVLIPCLFTSSPEGWEPVPELLEAFRTEFALRLFWGQQGAVADKKERYEKFDKILCVLSDKLEPVEVTPQQPGALT